MLKIAFASVTLIGLAYGASLIGPPETPETLGQRADRECRQANKDDREWCRTKILLRPAYDAANR